MSGTVTHAEDTTAPTPTTSARSQPPPQIREAQQREDHDRDQRQIARLEVKRDRQRHEERRREARPVRDAMARHVNAHASGNVHDAHSCAHTPKPIQTYALGSYPTPGTLASNGEHDAATAAGHGPRPNTRAAA